MYSRVRPPFGNLGNLSRSRRLIRRVLGQLRILGPTREVLRTLQFIRFGLSETGWRLSARRGVPVSALGEPIPWFTYPAIWFLEQRLPSLSRVFEWGCGHSTLWLGRRVAEVVSVEHDPGWAEYVRQQATPNVKIIVAQDEKDYGQQIKGLPFVPDVVVIDGKKGTRYACGQVALEVLAPLGVLVWDNAEWPDFSLAWRDYLAPNGFRVLTFRGFGPLGWKEWKTAVCYRAGQNVLGI